MAERRIEPVTLNVLAADAEPVKSPFPPGS